MTPAAARGTLSILAHHLKPWVMRTCACAQSHTQGKYLTTVPATIEQPLSDPALISQEFQGFESD